MAPKSLMSVEWDPHPAIVAAQFYTAAHVFKSGFRNELLTAVKQVVIPAIERNFDQEGVPSWAPLADSTISRRLRQGTGTTILNETGTLRSVATSMRPWVLNDNEAYLMGGNLDEAYYGVYHEFGTRWMPQRSWATITPDQENKIVDVFADASTGKLLKIISVATLVGGSIGAAIGIGFGAVARGISRLSGR